MYVDLHHMMIRARQRNVQLISPLGRRCAHMDPNEAAEVVKLVEQANSESSIMTATMI